MMAEAVIAGGALVLAWTSAPVWVKSKVAVPGVGLMVMVRWRGEPSSMWSVAVRVMGWSLSLSFGGEKRAAMERRRERTADSALSWMACM